MSACLCTNGGLHLDCPLHGRHAQTILSEAIDKDRVIQAQPIGRCQFCNAVEETRPYGPNGEEVCFSCGMKDEDAAKAAFDRRYA